jgi:rubrerythrin
MTVENFSILEAVELAVGIEEEGIRFYTLAAEKVTEPELKELFENLKDKEYDHIKTFRSLYSTLAEKKGDPDAELYLFDPEVAAYFHGYIETAVFPVAGAAKSVMREVEGPEDILRLAMQAEKDSMLFYHELLLHAPWPEAEELVKKVIKEEHKHFAVLRRELQKIQAKG